MILFLIVFNISGYCSLTYPNFTDGNVKVGCYYFTMTHSILIAFLSQVYQRGIWEKGKTKWCMHDYQLQFTSDNSSFNSVFKILKQSEYQSKSESEPESEYSCPLGSGKLCLRSFQNYPSFCYSTIAKTKEL